MNVQKGQSTVGMFLVNYRLTTGLPGAPILTLGLMADRVGGQVAGIGQVTQALQHPDLVTAQMTGSYREYSDVNGPNYVISLTGYPPVSIAGSTGPVLEAELIMVGGWDSGTAIFSFKRALHGPMTHIADAKVEKIKQA